MKEKVVIFYPKLEPNREYHYMPLSALSVASKLIADGKDVVIVDDRVIHNAEKQVLKELTNSNSLYISMYTGYQVTRGYDIAKLVKQKLPQVKITIGGPHVTALPAQTLQSEYVDYIYPGYAEHGEYPMPWHLIDHMRYINTETQRFIYVSTYSCPGICSFCSTQTKRKWIELPLAKVTDDIDRLMQIYPYKECVFFDATAFTNGNRALELSNIMRKHNLKWIADARAIEIVKLSKPLLHNIVSSGLKRLTIGLESGSDRIVQKMLKGKNHLETFEQCARILAEYPIKMCSGVIFGYPGETPEDLKETIAYIKKIKKINPNFYLSTTFLMPLPDTIASDEAKEYGHKEPESLEEWAILGENNHFKYNSFMDNPWILHKEEYKKIYDAFIQECDFLI